MTAATTARPRLAPSRADIAQMTADIGPVDLPGKYAYATGYLGGLIRAIAESHHRCRKSNCDTCRYLRRGLTLIAAVEQETNP